MLAWPWRAAAASTAALVALLLAATLSLGAYDALRERAFDVALGRFVARPPADLVKVVDIDRASLERLGPWPWSREQIAALVSGVLAAGPAAVGVDILIEGPDERSPAALAMRLADLTGNETARQLSATLIDGDRRLAETIRGRPVVLGLGLDPERQADLAPHASVLVQGASYLPGIWQAAGVAAPPRAVADAAAGLGVLALGGDVDGRIRRVPLLAAGGAQLRPGLAIETARVAGQASAYVLARGNVLRVGRIVVPLPPDATLRLLPPSGLVIESRTVSAADIDRADIRAALAGRIVMIGGSAPELGGLRLVSGGALVPSVQRQASAVAQILTGIHPRRPTSIELVEAIAIVLTAITCMALTLMLPMRMAGALAAAGVIVWLAVCVGLLNGLQILLDPVAVPIALAGSFTLSAAFVAAQVRRREAALRRRFEQHLAPELVTRLAEDPSLLKLAGETREASILFTDVEGFTAMTERSDPALLIRVLDRYIDEMSAIIVAHGGMVEKIVGDGFHGLFNAPLDLPGHADKAVACARAIHAFSLRFAVEPEPSRLGFGRTRVGVETGDVIVGDVGGGTRLDYTAYGNAMNTAARLEAANKDLGSAICIGPGTAARLTDRSMLRPLGALAVRGRSEPMEVYDIWPAAMTAGQRTTYLDALGSRDASALELLARELPSDGALRETARRMRVSTHG